MADEKKYLRAILSECRASLPAAYAASSALMVQRRLLDSDFYRGAESLVLYAAKDHEIATDELFAAARREGRRVYYPRIARSRDHLVLVRVDNPAELRPGAYGLLEPAGAEIVPPDELGRALICVPGVAFGVAGERLGRGGGYYDRMLAIAGPQAVTAGLSYSFQLLDRLPETSGDRRLDVIVTESALHATGHAPRPATEREADQGGVTRCW
jgi:5-formyltetrahydrofolate cyclo-ligase